MLRYQWCRNITIDGHFFIEGFLGLDCFPSSRAKLEAEQYERAVYRQLDQIMRNNYAGYGVLQTITDTGKSVKIVPDSKWEKKRIEGAHATIQGWDGVRNIPASAIAGGAPSLIEFSPDSGGTLKCHAGNKTARQPDEILLHELVHAMRYCQGKWYSEPLSDKGAALTWGNLEEFLAILVTNVYMSEKNRGPLRGQWITTTSDCDYVAAVLRDLARFFARCSMARADRTIVFSRRLAFPIDCRWHRSIQPYSRVCAQSQSGYDPRPVGVAEFRRLHDLLSKFLCPADIPNGSASKLHIIIRRQ